MPFRATFQFMCCAISLVVRCLTQLDMRLRYIGGSAADARSLDVDLVAFRSGLPCQVRERSCGWTVDHTPVQGKFRPVARAHKMPLSVIECVGAAEVWTGDCECPQLPILACHEAAKSRIARRAVSYTHLTLPTNREV